MLSDQEIAKLISALTNLKHKILMVMLYSAGLLVGEVVRLRPEDIDSSRKLVLIRTGKGGKDRDSNLLDAALAMLRNYYREYKPQKWLFPGVKPGSHTADRTVQRCLSTRKRGFIKMPQFIVFAILL